MKYVDLGLGQVFKRAVTGQLRRVTRMVDVYSMNHESNFDDSRVIFRRSIIVVDPFDERMTQHLDIAEARLESLIIPFPLDIFHYQAKPLVIKGGYRIGRLPVLHAVNGNHEPYEVAIDLASADVELLQQSLDVELRAARETVGHLEVPALEEPE